MIFKNSRTTPESCLLLAFFVITYTGDLRKLQVFKASDILLYEAFSFTKRPDNPTFVVQGVNSTEVSLVWEFVLESNESIVSIFIFRSLPGQVPATIASRLENTTFSLTDVSFEREYRALLPATLQLLNVNEDEEYDYFLQATIVQSSIPKQRTSRTRIVVQAHPPTSSTDGSTAPIEPPSDPAVPSGLSKAAIWGIIGGCIPFALIIAVIILALVWCICSKKRRTGGATKAGKICTEADGYHMQPTPSVLGTASTAYGEAGMYAPANATK